MYFQTVAQTVSRLVLILFFVLALAGCGDDGDDTDPHMDEHDHDEHVDMDEHDHEHAEEFPGRLMVMDADNNELQVLELESGQVVSTFALPQSMATGFGTLLRTSSDGRFAFALQRTGHYSPENEPEYNQIVIFDSGLTIEGHGDHSDPVWGTPTRLPYRLGHGAWVMDPTLEMEMDLYRPIHWSSHHGLTAIFYDGSRRDDFSESVNGYAVAYEDSNWDSETAPMPIFELDVGSHAHGGAVAFHHDLFVVSVGMNDNEGGLAYSTLPRGVAAYRADATHWEDNIIPGQDFRGLCPRLHGEAVSGDYVAFGCNEGPEDNDNPNYTSPTMITDRSGVLVLSYDADRDEDGDPTGPFVAAEAAYPNDGLELTSGGIRGGVGPSVGIFMATYGEHFLKITASMLDYDSDDVSEAGSELFEVETGSGRHRGYYFEPVDDNFPMGEGRFVVLTGTDNLYIFDLADGTQEMLDMKEKGRCPDGCTSLALAPGFAYVTDRAANKVYEVHLEDAEVEREFDLNAPTSLVVLGWFDYDEEIVFH